MSQNIVDGGHKNSAIILVLAQRGVWPTLLFTLAKTYQLGTRAPIGPPAGIRSLSIISCLHTTVNVGPMHKKVNSRKQLARQHSCHKIFGRGRRRGRPMAKIFPSSCLITMQNLLTVFRIVCVHVGGPKKIGGDAWARPLGWRAWQKERRPSDTCVTTPNLIAYDCNYGGPPENFSPIVSRLSRSLSVIGSWNHNTDRSANHWPILYRFRDKRRFRSKIAKLFHPGYLMPPAEGFRWNFVTTMGFK